ncbi:Cytochrome P450 CYP82J17 [Linum perenne]
MIAISGVALLLTLVLVHNLRRNIREGPNSAPEPPGVLPIIGHLHLIARSRLPLTQTLADFCDQHGPVVSLWLGAYRTIIVCHPDVIKECLTTNDKVLAARPPSSVGKYITYNYASIGFAPDGPYHQWLRKIVATKLLSPQRLKYLKHVQAGVAIQVRQHVELRKGKELGKLMKEFARVVGVLVPSDLIPALGWTNFLPGPVRYLKRVAREFDAVMQRWIEEHESMSEVGDESYKNDESRGQGFIDVMLSVSKDDFSTFGHSVHTIIKSNAMTLLTARAETTRITLIWIISNLLNNKRALKLVQEELDSIVGRERWVDDSDIEKLVYLQAVIKETMRLYPAGPLAAPHVATKDCLIAGHHVPKGTRVLLNLWKMQRDPVVWSNPNEFIPERFLEEKAHLDPLG